ncbi:MAG: terminase family protein [Clostridia bacterium]
MDYTITLPRPHEKQRAFIYSTAKRKIIVAGRRGGKTTGASMLAAMRAMDGRRVLEAAPVSDQTNAFWESVKGYFAEPIASKVVRKNETDRLLEFPNGGRIRCKTAHDADTLRGDFADLLILDEYSFMEPDAWELVGMPMLADNDGDAVFIFTPNRRNHAYLMYQKAIADETSRWGAWNFTSMDNPYLSVSALSDLKQDMTDEAYRQEIMAEFLEGEGAVFRNIYACMHAPLDAKPEDHAGHELVLGGDWGKQHDYTALSVGCVTCKKEVARDRFNKIDYHFQRGRLGALCHKWGVSRALVELNSIGEPNFEELQRSGLPVVGFQTTAQSKPQLIENMALVLEKAEWQFQADPVWTGELEAYERKVSAITGRSQYSAPEGMHDDTVMGRALMLRAAMQYGVEIVDNPFYD